MTQDQKEVLKIINHLKTVGLHFGKEMIKMLDNNEIKPPKGYTIEEYKALIDVAVYEYGQRSAENTNKKNKKIKDASA